jgi:hypothetical protein
MKIFSIRIGLCLLLLSCQNSDKVSINEETELLDIMNENTIEIDSIVNTNLGPTLFLDYKVNMSEFQFNNTTNILVEKGKVEHQSDGIYYLFPSCGGTSKSSGDNFNKYKINPVFEKNKLVSVDIEGLQSGAKTMINGTVITCISKKLIEKYGVKFETYFENIKESEIARYNDNYDPVLEFEYKGKNFKLPNLLIDKSNDILPGDEKLIYTIKNEAKEFEPIIIEKNGIIIKISRGWSYSITNITSIENSNEYKTYMSKLTRNSFEKSLEFSLKYRPYLNRNSKQIITTTWLNYKVNLSYMTKEHYLNQKLENIPKLENQSIETDTINEL